MTKAKMKVTIEAEGKGEYVASSDGTLMFISSSRNAAHLVAHFDDAEEAMRSAFGLALATGSNFTGEI